MVRKFAFCRNKQFLIALLSITTFIVWFKIFTFTPFNINDDANYLEWQISLPDFKYLVVPHRPLCAEPLTVLICVKSAVSAAEYRQVIRQTYALNATELNMRVVFFIGSSTDPFYQRLILLEAEMYDDIVQADYFDSYRNLTIKSYSLLRWQVMMCNNAKYYFNTDSDVMVFPQHLLDFATNMTTQTSAIVGHCKIGGGGVVRKNSSKWYVSEEVYKAKKYPPHCLGCGYISTGDVPSKLINAIEGGPDNWKRWKDMPIDDVVFTGILVADTDVKLYKNTTVIRLSKKFDLCTQKIVSVHRFNPGQMRQHWDAYGIALQNCTDHVDSEPYSNSSLV